jgi:hypothetical protein
MVLKIALFEALNLNNNTRIIRLLRTSPNVPQGGADAPVAQLDRVAGSDPVGRGFDSLLARPEFYAYSTFRGAHTHITRCFLSNNHLRCSTLRDPECRCLR